jgi:hypothetical protein
MVRSEDETKNVNETRNTSIEGKGSSSAGTKSNRTSMSITRS